MRIPPAARRYILPLFVGVLAVLAVVLAARADEQRAGLPGAIESKDDTGTAGGTRNADDTFGKTDYRVDTKLTPDLSVSSQMRVRPPGAASDGGIAEDRGLYLEQMYATYEKQHGGLRMGKYDSPAFGMAHDPGRGPGVLGWESPMDQYRLGRAIGANPFAKLDGGLAGNYRLDANIFRPEDAADASAIGTPTPDPATGAPAPSAALSLDGRNVLGLPGLGYRLGLQHLARDPSLQQAGRDGAAAGVSYGTALPDGTKLRTTGELGYMRETDAAGNETLRPGMALQGTLDDSWRAFANYSAARDANAPPEAAPAEQSYGAGLGYRFGQGPSLDMAWTRKKTEHEPLGEDAARDSVGLRMRYDLKF